MSTGVFRSRWSPPARRVWIPSTAGGAALTLDISDAISLSDAPANEPRPAYTETITMSEALAKEPRPVLSDSISLADALEKLVAMGALSDSITLSDSVATAIVLILEIADSITLADARTVEAQLAKADSVVLTDALANHFTMAALIDGLSLSDSVATAIVLLLQLADALSLSDDGTRQLGKVVADAIALADDAFKTASIVHGDSLTLSDVLETVRGLSASVSDSITLGDSTVTDIVAVAAAVRFWRARQRETVLEARRRETIFNGRPA